MESTAQEESLSRLLTCWSGFMKLWVIGKCAPAMSQSPWRIPVAVIVYGGMRGLIQSTDTMVWWSQNVSYTMVGAQTLHSHCVPHTTLSDSSVSRPVHLAVAQPVATVAHLHFDTTIFQRQMGGPREYRDMDSKWGY
jgi:hypothetical protein